MGNLDFLNIGNFIIAWKFINLVKNPRQGFFFNKK